MLICGFGLMGVAGVGADYVMQEQKAEGTYNTGTYINGLFDRFGNDGGFLGLIFRDSAAIDVAMPDAPEGWEPWYIDDNHTGAVYSAEQWQIAEREFEKVQALVPELEHLSDMDQEIWQAYFDDTSTAYTSAGDTILMYITDDENEINQPALRKFHRLLTAHYAAIDTQQTWRSFNDQTWMEITGPVTQADNGGRWHKLRMFETKIGSVTIYLEARASENAIIHFLERFDLTGLRQLGYAKSPKTAALQNTSPKQDPTAEVLPPQKGAVNWSLRPQIRPAQL